MAARGQCPGRHSDRRAGSLKPPTGAPDRPSSDDEVEADRPWHPPPRKSRRIQMKAVRPHAPVQRESVSMPRRLLAGCLLLIGFAAGWSTPAADDGWQSVAPG